MAEIRTEREETPMPHSDVHPDENLRTAAPLPAGHALPGGTPRPATAANANATVSEDPEAVRAEIEQTRERMSGTIDEIEEALIRKKTQIQDRLDVMAPVRERPLPAAGIAFGVGLVVGLLTGGDEYEEDVESRGRARSLDVELDEGREREERARMWENRARRLLRVAREQEEEIRDLQERYGNLYARDVDLGGWESDEEAVGELRSSVGTLRDTVLHGLTGFLTDAFNQMAKGGASRA